MNQNFTSTFDWHVNRVVTDIKKKYINNISSIMHVIIL